MSRRAPAPPPKSSSSTVRTVVLVAAVAGIAALILSRGFGGSSTPGTGAATGSGGTTKATKAPKPGATTTLDPAAPTTVPPTAPPPTVAPAALKVVVLNGNGIAGTAGKRTTELIKLGYAATVAKDAIKKDFAETGVYFTSPANKDVANALAAKMGLTAALAPTDTSYVDPAVIAGMDVIIVLGKDKASTPIANAATPAPAATTTPPLTAAKATATTKKP